MHAALRLTLSQWHLASVEVVSVGTGISYLFVCGQWLSLERGHSIVEKDYESGKVRVGVILQNPHNTQSQCRKKMFPVEVEVVEGSQSDVRISMQMDHPIVRKAPILYRYWSARYHRIYLFKYCF